MPDDIRERASAISAPDKPLQGKAAIITGSTSGIGLAIAKEMAFRGASILLNGLGDAAEIEQTRRSLASESGAEVRYSDADMRDPMAIEAMVEAARTAFGSVDILVNNAGIQ
ncbi:MAG: SDR family NAD(P)-dependent oxidoreductase, partial [Dongiaceae bacterium]